MFKKITIIIHYEKMALEIVTDTYTRTIQCMTMESFLEEVKRNLNDINEYNKNIKVKELL